MVKRFLNSRRSGIYFSVVQKGEVGSGDVIELVSRDATKVTVADIIKTCVREADQSLVRRAVQVPALADGLKTYGEMSSLWGCDRLNRGLSTTMALSALGIGWF